MRTGIFDNPLFFPPTSILPVARVRPGIFSTLSKYFPNESMDEWKEFSEQSCRTRKTPRTVWADMNISAKEGVVGCSQSLAYWPRNMLTYVNLQLQTLCTFLSGWLTMARAVWTIDSRNKMEGLPWKLLFILSFYATRNVWSSAPFPTPCRSPFTQSKWAPNASGQVALMLPINFFPINLLIGTFRVCFREAWKTCLVCVCMKRNHCSPGFKDWQVRMQQF